MNIINFLSEDLNIVTDEVTRLYAPNIIELIDPISFNKNDTNDLILGVNKVGFLKSLTLVGIGSVVISFDQGESYTVNVNGMESMRNIWVTSLTSITSLDFLSGFGWLITLK